MAAPKGIAQNPAGRPPGIPNKTTTIFKEKLNELLELAAPQMIDKLEQIKDPVQYFEVLNKFVEYIHPKLSRTDSNIDLNAKLQVNWPLPKSRLDD